MYALTRHQLHAVALALVGTIALLVVVFTLRSQAAPASTLTLSASSVPQESDITLTGQGFEPGEPVSIWQTFPDLTVTALPQQTASASGAFSFSLFVGKDLPVGRYTFTAHGISSGREEYVELALTVAKGPQPNGETRLSAEPGADRQGAVVTLRGAGFGPNEAVALWGRYPDGGSFDLAQVTSDGSGAFDVLISFSGNPTGAYVFSAKGLSSGRYTFGEMRLDVGDLTGPSQPATLTARPTEGAQRRSVTIEGAGFGPEEAVTIWTTLPDNATMPLAQVATDKAGRFTVDILLDESVPVGQHVFSARGNASARLATLPYFLDAGGGPRQP